MLIDRRNLIKGLVALPFAHQMPKAAKSNTDPTTGPFYVLLHGLLFMEYGGQDPACHNRDLLTIKAPYIPGTTPSSGHLLFCGPRGNVQPCTAPTIDWTSCTDLQGANRGDFSLNCPTVPSAVDAKTLQFSRKETGVGDLDQPVQHTITLPWPETFYAIRLNTMPRLLSDFQGKPQQEVRQSLQQCSGDFFDQLGLVTVLQYSRNVSLPSDPQQCKYHFYFEADPNADQSTINDHLNHAKKVFTNPQAFDLQIDSRDINNCAAIQTTHLPGCIDQFDEWSYYETLFFNDLITLYTEEQRLIHEGAAQNPKLLPLLKSIRGKLATQKAKWCQKGKSHPNVVSSANCPTFFVG
ncbi:MAG: hypothetical protein LAP21_20125 [Acidobacteriia bacterium]|nr:hypothetical protein [Terriglobia bacterium]